MVQVLRFTASWCGPCKVFGPVADAVLDELGATHSPVDIDASPDRASEYGIQSVPTTIVLQDGVEVHRIVGALSKPKLRAELEPFI